MLELAKYIGDLAIQAIALEWKAQGHNLSGKAVAEMELVIKETGNSILIYGMVLDYMATINQGVTAAKIPYSPGSGAKSSQYIQGLISYVKRRMNKSDKEATSIAFAIASKHKKEGMPSRSSVRFSSTGKRTGFIEIALSKIEPKMLEAIQAAITLTVESFFKSQLNR